MTATVAPDSFHLITFSRSAEAGPGVATAAAASGVETGGGEDGGGDCVASREAAGDGATGGGAQSGPGAATAAAASGVGTEGGDGTMADFFLREPPRTFQILSRVCDVVALIRMALAHLDPHPFNELAAPPREDVSDSS